MSNKTSAKTGTSVNDLQAELDRLRAENQALRAAESVENRVTLKVSEKTGCVVIGMPRRRYPVSLYHSDWAAIMANREEIEQFFEDNREVCAELAAAARVK